MGIAEVAIALIGLASKLAERAQQSGEMTDAQKTELRLKAAGIFLKFDQPAPPPPGV